MSSKDSIHPLSSCTSISILCGLFLVGLASLPLLAAAAPSRLWANITFSPWEEVAIPNAELVFMRRHIHPFLSEYDRKLKLELEVNTATVDLRTNTGGRTNLVIYETESHYILRDRGHWIEINRNDGTLLDKDVTLPQNAVYIGKINADLSFDKEPLETVEPSSD